MAYPTTFDGVSTSRPHRGAGSMRSKIFAKRFVEETNPDPKPFVWTADPRRPLAAAEKGRKSCSLSSQYPPAKPGALDCQPLKAACPEPGDLPIAASSTKVCRSQTIV
jgi:hypothetical protein